MTSRKDRRSRVHALSVALTCLPGCGGLADTGNGSSGAEAGAGPHDAAPAKDAGKPNGGAPDSGSDDLGGSSDAGFGKVTLAESNGRPLSLAIDLTSTGSPVARR